uniref:Uncharacterized protein n=1 Tax=viral metagenome TaxID=1070528 RepID=A0A6C0BJT4_9ZZZZ
MCDLLSHLFVERKSLSQQLHEHQKAVSQLKRQVDAVDCEIFQVCPHQWEIDRAVYSEHTEYVCRICGLGKFPSAYSRKHTSPIPSLPPPPPPTPATSPQPTQNA